MQTVTSRLAGTPPAAAPKRKTPRLALAVLFIATALFFSVCGQHSVHASSSQKTQGQLLYRQSGCEHCHGTDLRGGDLGPDISTIGKQWKKPQIEHQIVHGGGGMPAFADTLQPDEISALVEFLHGKRKAPKGLKTSPTAPPPAPPSIEDR